MSKLYYGHTCPAIDSGLGNIMAAVKDNVTDLLERVNDDGRLDSNMKYLVEEWVSNFCQDINPEFEAVRSTNEDMRSVADHQIYELDRKVEELELLVEELRTEIANLHQDIY